MIWAVVLAIALSLPEGDQPPPDTKPGDGRRDAISALCQPMSAKGESCPTQFNKQKPLPLN
jgi:hypothetical protein